MSDWLDIIEDAEKSRDAAVTRAVAAEGVVEIFKKKLDECFAEVHRVLTANQHLSNRCTVLEHLSEQQAKRLSALEKIVMASNETPPSIFDKLNQLLTDMDHIHERVSKLTTRLGAAEDALAELDPEMLNSAPERERRYTLAQEQRETIIQFLNSEMQIRQSISMSESDMVDVKEDIRGIVNVVDDLARSVFGAHEFIQRIQAVAVNTPDQHFQSDLIRDGLATLKHGMK